MANNKMSATPPTPDHLEDIRDKFIKEAEVIIASEKKEGQPSKYPWNDEKVREDIRKAFTVTLPEAYVLKLKYLSEKTNKSQQKIAREALCEKIDHFITTLTS
jgi:hypothetical protein